jgi:hypothetical protein
LDAGLVLVAFTIGLYAVRLLRGQELGAYALFFAAYVLTRAAQRPDEARLGRPLNSSRALDLATVEAYRNREEP